MSPLRNPALPGGGPARLAILVHGSPQSVEAVRARELSAGLPQDRFQCRVLHREGPRTSLALRWHRQLREYRPHALYVLNTALPGAVLAPGWGRWHGIPFALDTGDVVYEMARASGVEPAWRLPFLLLVEKLALRNATRIVVRGSRHRDHLLGLGHRHVEVIRDGYVDPGPVAPTAVAALRRRLGLPEDAFVVGVLGSLVHSPRLDICYGWDLISALSHLAGLPVHGLIIGDGNGLPWLQERARVAGVSHRLTFAGRIPYEEVQPALRLMDIALSTQTNNLAGQVRTTGKLPEYMAAGRFILASRVGDATLLLPEPMLVDFHGAVDREYPARLAARIREVQRQPALQRLADELPARAREFCSYDVLRPRFHAVVASLIAGGMRGTGDGGGRAPHPGEAPESPRTNA